MPPIRITHLQNSGLGESSGWTLFENLPGKLATLNYCFDRIIRRFRRRASGKK